jgi:hypothetical protein
MRARAAVATVLAAFTVGCSTTGTGRGVSASPVDPGTPTASASASPSVDATPAADGSLETGAASVSVSGDVTAQVGLPTLFEPDVWSTPPGPMDLGWTEPGGQELRLTGTSFSSRLVTASDRTLSLTLDGPDGPVEFSSSDGGCSITITPALPDNVGGLFTCASLTDVTGSVTIQVQGSFSATG